MSPTQEIARDIWRGANTAMSGHTRRLKKMRRQAEESDYLREAWEEVGIELQTAANRESKENSYR